MAARHAVKGKWVADCLRPKKSPDEPGGIGNKKKASPDGTGRESGFTQQMLIVGVMPGICPGETVITFKI